MKLLVFTTIIISLQYTSECSEQQQQQHASNNNYGKIVNKAPDKRETTAWRWKYYDEFVPERSSVLIRETTLDERLANVNYAVGSSKLKTYFPRFNSGDQSEDELNKRLIAGAQVNDELCGEHLTEMLHQIDELAELLELKRLDRNNSYVLEERHIQLARVLDSFGRYESGHLAGKTQSMGAYDLCLASQLNVGQTNSVKTRFCWAQMSLNNHLDSALLSRPKTIFDAEATIISTGICIPESCHSKSFQANRELFQDLVDSQFQLPASLYVDENLELDDLHCLIDENSEWSLPFSGKLLVFVLVVWLVLGVMVTLSGTKNTLSCLNFSDSWREFTTTGERATSDHQPGGPTSSKPVEFASLNTLKVLATAYVVFGHVFLQWWVSSMNYLRISSEYQTSRILMPMMIGAYVVDMFFVMTGMLTSYQILKHIFDESGRSNKIGEVNNIKDNECQVAANGNDNTHQKNNINATTNSAPKQQKTADFYLPFWGRTKLASYFIAARYLRLVPMYYLFYWFKRSVIIYTRDGPHADTPMNRNTLAGSCKYNDHWLNPLLPSAAYTSSMLKCLPQAWSISSDLTFTVVIVPLIVYLWRNLKLATGVLVALSLVSLRMAQQGFEEADSKSMWEVNELKANGFGFMLNDLSYLYTGPHYRFSSIASGVLAGFVLIRYEKFGPNSTLNGRVKQIVTLVAFMLTLYPFVSAGLMREIRPMLGDVQHVYPNISTTFRAIWAASVAILLCRIVTDWKDWSFFGWGRTKLWKTLVKLDYIVLLIHMEVIYWCQNEWTTSRWLSKRRVAIDFVSVYVISLSLSSIIHVLFESPTNKLVRRLVLGARRQMDSEQANNLEKKKKHS